LSLKSLMTWKWSNTITVPRKWVETACCRPGTCLRPPPRFAPWPGGTASRRA
jgi:hypothetical protein